MSSKKTFAPKGTIIQRKGDLGSKIYIVKKGLLRSYSVDNKGKEHVFMFGPEGWVVADACRETDPCELFIDALEDTEYVTVVKDVHRDANPHSFEQLVKRMLVMQRRTLMLMSASAIERYEHFERTYPDILQRVSQRMVASYLGITPEALSKIKRERVRGKSSQVRS